MKNELNRSVPPLVVLPENIKVPHAAEQKLDNGMPIFIVNSGEDPVCRIDVLLNAGSRYQQNNLEATATASLLSEGTTLNNSQQIAEFLDYHGSFIDLSADRDWGKVTLYCLEKYFERSIAMLAELVMQPIFPEKELKIWSERSKQKLTLELDRTSTLARQAFFNQLYGKNHPYGRFATPSDYNLLESNKLLSFHKKHFSFANSTIILSGSVGEMEFGIVNKYFGKEEWGGQNEPVYAPIAFNKPGIGLKFVEKKDAVQSAIRIGCRLIKRNHPEYPIMLIVNTILGGYFGSRLMKNIREEKGYTYGINSHIVTLRDDGFFVIGTEVGSQFTQLAIKEIRNEIERLRHEPVGESELQQVKSYMWGEALRSFNGPFAIADNVISLLNFNNLDYGFYDQLFKTIKEAKSENIMNAARKWLNVDEMVCCVAGSVNPEA
ncbi:MAG TPA: pitrilysin family protein [Tenuifilaceae bacterium]|nr:pitrilysin family protein [Tenuifilaceae bacterium]